MGHQLLAMGASMALVLSSLPSEAAQPHAQPEPGLASVGTSGGFRTDRLSRKELETWSEIVEIVTAEDGDGRPLHPTLRQLWDAVDTSGHALHIEMPDPKGLRSFVGGRFTITRVDPEGKAHAGILILDLRVIDSASANGTPRANGFVPFKGLGKKGRYAEVLGHELAHAVWTFASAERSRRAQQLREELKQWAKIVRAGKARDLGGEVPEYVKELHRLSRLQEEPAEAAEEAIWAELRAGRRSR